MGAGDRAAALQDLQFFHLRTASGQRMHRVLRPQTTAVAADGLPVSRIAPVVIVE